MKNIRCADAMLFIVSLIMLSAGFIKLFSACGNMKFLNQSDPLLRFISNRDMLCLAGIFEIVIAVVILNQKVERATKGLLLLWVASLFCLYRFGLWLEGYSGPCPCFGNAYHWLGLEAATLDGFAKLCIGYFALTGAYLVFWQWKEKHGAVMLPPNQSESHDYS